ncbi:MAG TPA: helix-turn-helix transcriptional regulator [Flavipsychrobacter sp.]|jgi:transcriptional regulator with XRE-family HTH domain|nr:helix-turn-helix transcriptional regulator [Flavipsychrobacter sp.]
MLSDPGIKDIKVKLGELVKLLRKKKGLSQESLGNQLNLSRITIQNLESGKNATLDTLLIVMQHFGLLNVFYDMLEGQTNNNNYDSLY